MNPMVITALIGSLARAIPAVQRLQLAALGLYGFQAVVVLTARLEGLRLLAVRERA